MSRRSSMISDEFPLANLCISLTFTMARDFFNEFHKAKLLKSLNNAHESRIQVTVREQYVHIKKSK